MITKGKYKTATTQSQLTIKSVMDKHTIKLKAHFSCGSEEGKG